MYRVCYLEDDQIKCSNYVSLEDAKSITDTFRADGIMAYIEDDENNKVDY